MSFIQVNLGDDVQEASVVDEDTYALTVTHVSDKPSKNTGRAMVTLMHVFEEFPNAAPVNVFLTMPQEGDEPSTVNMMQLNIKRYLEMAGLEYDPNGFDTDILYGASFTAFVTKDEIMDEDNDGAPFNPPQFRNNIQVPRLTSED